MPLSRPRRAVALAIASALAACGPASEDEEVALGRETAAQMDAQLPLLADPLVTRYVDSLGTAIARRTARADLAWRFAVVDADVVNAFALPGGFIYVYRGLLERAGSMSELAGVLGHEVEHVVRRHSVEQMRKAQGAQTGVSIVCSLTGWCQGPAAQIGIQVGGSLLFARFGREAEREADAGAFDNVRRSGIDPEGMRTFFEQLAEEERRAGGGAEALAWFADHPGTGDRIAEIERMLGALPADARAGLAADDAGFQRVRARLAALPPARRVEGMPGS
ncbi:M48 family metallopeptidase [Roseisolibacter sp. H3M3-2]|uniref:M48 family metallopeptidase n=1 Tax=Roseisolibacter sp. H3M3-2 TaxID=3031323 RepID=UPI0023DA2B6C|nr:M48 family metallopeptidase [Roseisolibacter sp. H3M3-2]MDF1503784.1 M48 family metallopeptidase [Roseisolibacter sp. H3M3-2]